MSVWPKEIKNKTLSPQVPGQKPATMIIAHTLSKPKQANNYVYRTQKKGCGTKMTVWQICIFPDYIVSSKNMVKVEQNEGKKRLLQDLNAGNEVRMENRCYINLPLKNAHSKHKV